jgi:periplasmic copper chaperone A
MSMNRIAGGLGAAALACLCVGAAQAHITLETQQAAVKSTYKAVLRVGHGCEGAASLKIRVQIPDGVIAVKPMPKPDWVLETIKAPYKQPAKYFDEALSEGVREITWTGKLLDEHYDEFIFRAYLSEGLKPDTILYFPAVQECEGGKADRWIEIPAEGKSADDYKYPAPGLQLTPARLAN